MGANNINLVTPTQFTLQIISALDKYRPKIPIIFNTSGYEKCETIEMLKNYERIRPIFWENFRRKRPKSF